MFWDREWRGFWVRAGVEREDERADGRSEEVMRRMGDCYGERLGSGWARE